ncbi:BTAD domain-containing putative transcriptional regulator [Bradyrhizobium sp. CB2312]|uniref:BTAD domain-containing putative transcriptional regulator n=1 Tax=Bradyrhizobium sp. CB2312 TaxID=3039155 RepID=UPI0024B1B30F|nr:BTAD domain-containing putative transcriptional regulator [Bradyrhizobium sp. CB2312]WFU72274.1 BTAD domain-containing putative transcriptional regulator [Bradyrhizobium sp. CB2312]
MAAGIQEALASGQLALRLLGDFAAKVDEREISLATRKAKALTAYLALSDNTQDTRERLVGLLWSESDEEHARASLRQVVHDLRLAFDNAGFEGFRADKQNLALSRTRRRCDVDEVLAAAAQGTVHPRLLDTPRITETLLSGLDNLDPAFQVWLLTKRQLFHDRLTLALERLLPREGDSREATDAALALLNLDPTHEIACQHLIRTRAARGDVGGALKIYKSLWDLLEADYDIEPSKETQELIVRIKQMPGPGEQQQAPAIAQSLHGVSQMLAPAPKRLLISVCAFQASGVPEGMRHLVDGFRHEFVACLARFREWSVRTLPPVWESEPRTWSSPPEYIVEGSTYELNGTVRLVITLRDAANSVCIWSERHSITLTEWFETQERIVRQIAMALNIHVSAERLRRLAAGGEITLEIHDRWLRGQALLLQMASKDWPAAAALIESLLADAPDFSPALSGLVQYRNIAHIALPGQFRDRAKHPETLRIAQRAIQLDPLDSRAQLALAWTYQLLGRMDESTLHAALAVDLNENDPWTLMASGQICAYCGEYERAAKLSAASLRITPVPTAPQIAYSGAIKFLCSDYAGCCDASREDLGMSPAFIIWECAAKAHLGRLDEARADLAKAMERVAADWHGQQKPTRENITRWLLHVFPIAIRADWERLAAGLAAAGAPVEGIEFGPW